MPASNERLASVYNPYVSQIVIVFPIMWKHHAGNGNWFIVGIL